MVRVNPYQASFNAGELSPKLVARVDFQRYPNGCSQLRNMQVMPQGGMSRRPGSRFAWEVKDSSLLTILKRFRFSVDQPYPLELGDGYLRFGRNQGRITVAETSSVITNGTFDSNISGWTDLSTGTAGIAHDSGGGGRLALVGGGSGNIAIAQQQVSTTSVDQEHTIKFRVIRGTPGDTITFQIGTSSGGSQVLSRGCSIGYHAISFTPPSSPVFIQFRSSIVGRTVYIDDVSILSDAPLEVDTPWGTDDLRSLRTIQSADVMYFARGEDTPIYRLERFSHTSWSLEEVLWQDGPYLDQNILSTTFTPSGTTGFITITASSVVGINSGQGFLVTDIGRNIRVKVSTNEPGWGTIVGWLSTTQVTVAVRRTFTSAAASTVWWMGAWSATTGYPRCLAFFEQRFVAASTTDNPQTMWFTQSADIENMRPDSWNSSDSEIVIEDDDALDFTIAAEEVQTILWMSSSKQLVLGTASGQWIVDSDGPVITPTDISVRQHSEEACDDQAPVRVSNVALFVQRSRRKLREFVFNFDVDSFISPDMTILSDHVTRTGLIDMDHQSEPDGIIWAIRQDGRLLSFTYDPLEEVRGWGQHLIGGTFEGGHSVVESVITIPGNDDEDQVFSSIERDEVWLIVKRTIDGTTKRYVEFLEGAFEGPLLEDYDTREEWIEAVVEAQKDAFYVDSGLTYEGTPSDVITGLDHLEGETVKILADGAAHPDKEVISGAVTLDWEVEKAQIGLGYTHKYKSLKIAAGSSAGTAVGKFKRIHGVTYVLLDSAAFYVGRDQESLNYIELREASHDMDDAVPLFTGEKYMEFSGGFSRDSRIYIESDQPLPQFILALAPEMQTNDLK